MDELKQQIDWIAMKSPTFLKPQTDRVETSVWVVISVVILLTIGLAGLNAITPPEQSPSRGGSPPAALVAPKPSTTAQGRLHQLVADMRTVVAALRYLMEPEPEPTVIA